MGDIGYAFTGNLEMLGMLAPAKVSANSELRIDVPFAKQPA
jgi:hypothetical protein